MPAYLLMTSGGGIGVFAAALAANRFGRQPELLAERPGECLVRAVSGIERHRQDVAVGGDLVDTSAVMDRCCCKRHCTRNSRTTREVRRVVRALVAKVY